MFDEPRAWNERRVFLRCLWVIEATASNRNSHVSHTAMAPFGLHARALWKRTRFDSKVFLQHPPSRFVSDMSREKLQIFTVEYRLVPFMDVYRVSVTERETESSDSDKPHPPVFRVKRTFGKHLSKFRKKWKARHVIDFLFWHLKQVFVFFQIRLQRSNCRGQNGGKWAFARASAFLECYRPWPDLTAFSSKKCGDVGRLAAGIQSIEKFASWLPWMVWEFWGSRAGWKHCKTARDLKAH